jgi:hypothetical protein
MFRVFAICFVFIFGCGSDHEPRPLVASRDDDAILNLVLADVSTYDGPDCPLSLVPQIPRDIFFLRTPIDWAPDAAKPLDHNNTWRTMSDSERHSTRTAIAHLLGRHTSDFAYRDFHPVRDAIHAMDIPLNLAEIPDAVPYGARFPIQAWSPGYSSDGLCVVVHLHFPELLHPSDATYVLISEPDGWKIKYREFITWV